MHQSERMATVETMNATHVKAILTEVATDMEAAKAHLCTLDGATGDGDLGVTMVLGFRAILKSLDHTDTDIGSVLVKAGAAFAKAAPSSMGALLGTALTRAGQEVMASRQIGVQEIARMAQAAERGIRERGKAQVGDKTVLDAAAPAVAAFVECAERGTSVLASFELAEAEAQKGLQRTTELRSRLGRAAALGDRTIGHPDAGAACACLILRSVVHSLRRFNQAPHGGPATGAT
jgi:dihydroxyacetone kinase-like protein